jgi:PHD/YefM family antitoxin component YafN of YafNO toxin-antitoxin module
MIYDANIVLDLSRDINSLSNFKRNTTGFIDRLKQTKSPLVLTINGVSELVVQSAEGYQQLLDRIEYLETTAGIKQGLIVVAAVFKYQFFLWHFQLFAQLISLHLWE